jgi:hypothetical protein
MRVFWSVAGALMSVIGLCERALAATEQPTAVPEPATLTLVVTGVVIAGVGAYRRRK